MRLVIIWSNGDEEKIEISDSYAEKFIKNHPYFAVPWFIIMTQDKREIGALNMANARKFYLEEE